MEAQIIEMSADTAEELKAIRQDNKALFKHVQDGFQQAYDYIKQEVETRLDRIETTLSEHGDLLRQILDRLPPKQ